MLRLAQNEGLGVAGIVVSENIDLTKEIKRTIPVFKISEVPEKYKNMKIIYSLDIKHKNDVSESLQKYKFEFV